MTYIDISYGPKNKETILFNIQYSIFKFNIQTPERDHYIQYSKFNIQNQKRPFYSIFNIQYQKRPFYSIFKIQYSKPKETIAIFKILCSMRCSPWNASPPPPLSFSLSSALLILTLIVPFYPKESEEPSFSTKKYRRTWCKTRTS